MNIFELTALVGIPAGAFAGYHFASPFGTVVGVLAAVVGAVTGRYIGPFLGLLFILPFEGMARLGRFLSTGRWAEPPEPPQQPPATRNDRAA